MNTAISYPSAPSPTKPLWAVIGVLGMCVLALGASLVSIHKRSAEPFAYSANPQRFAGLGSALGLAAPGAGHATMITETADGRPIENPLQAQENTAKPTAKNAAKVAPSKTPSRTPAGHSPSVSTQPAAGQGQATAAHGGTTVASGGQAPAPQPATTVLAQAPAKPVCTSCGTIEAVTPVTRPGKASGVGMVAGGVLGGVLGNQVGGGNGRTAATVLGAVGGGWAGNAVEKNIKKDTIYQVRVRMQDGSTRTLEQASAPVVGSKVTVEGATLRSSIGQVYAPAPEQRARAPQPQPQRDGNINGG